MNIDLRQTIAQKNPGRTVAICVSCFIAMFLQTGMIKCLGVLLPVLREQFTTHTWVIGLIISFLPGFGAVTCVAATVLRKFVSSRYILLSFSLLSCLGFLTISRSWSLSILAIGVVLAGFSLGAEATIFSILPSYFDKYYDFVNSLSHVGLSAGVMTMPLLTTLLLDTYGWRGTMLTLAALNSNTVLVGLIVVDVPIVHDKFSNSTDPHEQDLTSNSRSNRTDNIASALDLEFFKNLSFISIMMRNFGNGYYYTGWLIYVVPHAEHLGFSPYVASAVATAGGIGSLAGSCLFPMLSRLVSSRAMIFIFHIIASLSLAAEPIASLGPYFTGVILCSVLLNFANGIWGSACIKECSKICGDEATHHRLLNWSYFWYGVGSVMSGFFSGWFFDKYKNYTASLKRRKCEMNTSNLRESFECLLKSLSARIPCRLPLKNTGNTNSYTTELDHLPYRD